MPIDRLLPLATVDLTHPALHVVGGHVRVGEVFASINAQLPIQLIYTTPNRLRQAPFTRLEAGSVATPLAVRSRWARRSRSTFGLVPGCRTCQLLGLGRNWSSACVSGASPISAIRWSAAGQIRLAVRGGTFGRSVAPLSGEEFC